MLAVAAIAAAIHCLDFVIEQLDIHVLDAHTDMSMFPTMCLNLI